jgi:hypothetical protein
MAKPILYKDNSKPQNILEALQSVILNRLFKPYGNNEPIVYEFTQDRAMLHQYYRLREVMYRKMFETDKFMGEEDLHDKLSYILIARRGRLCLGGCRLTIREHDEMWQLPMEGDEFKLRNLFPDLHLEKERHGEISRFAIMEDSGSDDNIFYGLCKVMYDKVTSSNIHYLFAKSTYPLARNWRLIANSFGVKTTQICKDLNVPENPIHPGVKWFVTLSDLSSIYPADSKETVAAEKPQLALID